MARKVIIDKKDKEAIRVKRRQAGMKREAPAAADLGQQGTKGNVGRGDSVGRRKKGET